MSGKRFKIEGRVYDVAHLDDISLKDMLQFEQQATDAGVPMSWADVEELAVSAKAATEMEALKVTAALVWLSRRVAGETDLTFGEALNIKVKDIDFLPETGDRKPGPTGARKGPKKKSTQRSAPAAPDPVTAAGSATTATSSSLSGSD